MGLQKRGSIYYAVFTIKGQRFSRTTGKTFRSAAARVEKQIRKEFLKKLAGPTKATESVTKQDLRLAEAATRIYEERWKHITLQRNISISAVSSRANARDLEISPFGRNDRIG